jgi:hypothetical protein
MRQKSERLWQTLKGFKICEEREEEWRESVNDMRKSVALFTPRHTVGQYRYRYSARPDFRVLQMLAHGCLPQ